MADSDFEKDLEQIKAQLGSEIRAAREANRLSLRELAEEAGVSAQAISQIEEGRSGDRGPGIWLVCRIGKALGVDLAGKVLRSTMLDGLGVVSDEGVEIIEKAQTKRDITPIRWPAHFRFAIRFQSGDRIVSAKEMDAIEQRCNAKLASLLAEG